MMYHRENILAGTEKEVVEKNAGNSFLVGLNSVVNSVGLMIDC